MTEPRRAWPWLLAGVAVLLAAALIAVNVALGHGSQEMLRRYTFTNVAFSLVGAPIAALILARYPRHRVGWILMSVAILGTGQVLGGSVAEMLAGDTPWIELPFWLKYLASLPVWAWIPAVFPFFLLLPLFFPDDRLPSPRWRWVAGAASIYIVAMAALFALAYYPWSFDDPTATIALIDAQAEVADPTLTRVIQIAFSLLPILAATVVASVVVRFRQARGVERRQLNWLLLAVLLAVPALVVAMVAQNSPSLNGDWVFVLLTLAVFPIPLAIGVAILRYQLFDVDIVVSRSLVVAGLGGFITVVYVAIVVGLGALIGTGDDPSLLLQVVATALVAVLFQPARRRMERWVNRVVYGDRASPYEVLSTFSREAASTADASLDGIAQLMSRGSGATESVVWLRVGEQFVPAAGVPPPNDIPTAERIEDLRGDLVTPVNHDGEILGALAISKPKSEPVTPQDADILERLATAVGVSLRNNRLTAELQARLEELAESRRRIVTAQDEARRKLERDLHDGAQQQLVALKVKLGLAKAVAIQTGAEKTSHLLEQISGEADAAVQTLRDLARGIYPPLLEAEGLTTAIESQTRTSPIPVTVHAAGVGRYSQEVESAVYFCVLEALSNVVKYSGAQSAHVRLHEEDGNLMFEVSDDGAGFDPEQPNEGTGLAGMADRLDTQGGDLVIESGPGKGTILTGVVPVAAGVAT